MTNAAEPTQSDNEPTRDPEAAGERPHDNTQACDGAALEGAGV